METRKGTVSNEAESLPCDEEWRDVHASALKGLYQVSSLGRVCSLRSGNHRQRRLLALWPDKDGYIRVSLSVSRHSYCFLVHRLVLWAFQGAPQDGQEGSHLDNDLANNRLSNLCWETHLENEQRKTRSGRRPFGENNHAARLTAELVRDYRQRWDNGHGVGLTTLAKEAGMSETAMYQALKGITWKHI